MIFSEPRNHAQDVPKHQNKGLYKFCQFICLFVYLDVNKVVCPHKFLAIISRQLIRKKASVNFIINRKMFALIYYLSINLVYLAEVVRLARHSYILLGQDKVIIIIHKKKAMA